MTFIQFRSFLNPAMDVPPQLERSHIQGSKIAKRLPSVKYSLLQYSEIEYFTKTNFSKKITYSTNGPSCAPGPASASPWRAERGTLPKLSKFLSQLKGFVAKHQKIEKGKKFYFRKKISQCRKKLEGGTLWDFPTSILSQNSKKIEGGPFGEKIFRKKSLEVSIKIGRGDPLVSPGMVRYAGKQEKPFWFSSLDQIVQFGAIIFFRTFKNYFGQFVWIEKKRKTTMIVAFHFMKRRLKNDFLMIMRWWCQR